MSPERRHHHILDNLTTAVLMLDEELQVKYVNPAAEALLAISGPRMLGHPIEDLFSEPGETSGKLREALGENSSYTKRETEIQLNNARTITVDYVVTPIIDTDRISGLIMELQPLDRLLRISREEGLLSSQQNTQALLRGLAHEVKNPLGGLRGAAQLLARELPDKRLEDYTNIIIEEADRLRTLVDTMLGPNRAPNFAPLNIHEVVERVRYLAEAECQGRIQFCRDYDPSIPLLSGDNEQLIQACLNIVRNAMQALEGNTAENPPKITLRTRSRRQITLGATRHRLVCAVSVIDNGPGIAPDMAESLFFPMVSSRPNGSGLGLSIAQSIINRHHGLIEYDSAAGTTEFTLLIPMEQTNDQD